MNDGLKIQCRDVQLCAAAWLDGQLSPAEAEFLEEHLSQCPSCEEMLNRMSEQPLSPPTLQVVQNDTYWRKMDEALALELSNAQKSNDKQTSWKNKGIYAAALLLMFFWGLHQQQRASDLQQMVEQQQRTLDHLERLATQPETPKTYAVPAKYVPAHLEL